MVQSEQRQKQERIEIDHFLKVVEHHPQAQHLINLHSLHNPHLIRRVLPRHLVQPVPYHQDRDQAHSNIAAGLRVSGPKHRLEIAEKARKTRELNAERRRAMEETVTSGSGPGQADGITGNKDEL